MRRAERHTYTAAFQDGTTYLRRSTRIYLYAVKRHGRVTFHETYDAAVRRTTQRYSDGMIVKVTR